MLFLFDRRILQLNFNTMIFQSKTKLLLAIFSTSSSVVESLLVVALHPEGTGQFAGSPSPVMRNQARVHIGIRSGSLNQVPAGFGGS